GVRVRYLPCGRGTHGGSEGRGAAVASPRDGRIHWSTIHPSTTLLVALPFHQDRHGSTRSRKMTQNGEDIPPRLIGSRSAMIKRGGVEQDYFSPHQGIRLPLFNGQSKIHFLFNEYVNNPAKTTLVTHPTKAVGMRSTG
ncbi:hypothetical protein CEXT_564491, partial [Caerostris extrusa]